MHARTSWVMRYSSNCQKTLTIPAEIRSPSGDEVFGAVFRSDPTSCASTLEKA